MGAKDIADSPSKKIKRLEGEPTGTLNYFKNLFKQITIYSAKYWLFTVVDLLKQSAAYRAISYKPAAPNLS